jgi:hypothetical protein
VGDPNLGGTEKRVGIMTAYRQRALEIAQFLQTWGPTKASRIAQALREPKAKDFLYRDVYGWFDRASLGVYDLSPRGRREIALWKGTTGDANSEVLAPANSLRGGSGIVSMDGIQASPWR